MQNDWIKTEDQSQVKMLIGTNYKKHLRLTLTVNWHIKLPLIGITRKITRLENVKSQETGTRSKKTEQPTTLKGR